MRFFRFTTLSIFILLVFTATAFSGTTGKIAGRITDAQTGDGLPGTNVQLEGTSFGAATDIDGHYTILNIPPGLYTLNISFIGYQTVRVREVRVNVDFTTRVDQALNQSAVEMAAIEVYGERNPLVREDLTNTHVAVTSEQIHALPVDQIRDVIALQAGIVQDNSGALHIRGGRSNEVAYQVNGISINNPLSNLQGVGIATNAVEEVSVSTGTFSAEYGNALSGVINFVTKDGGPKYHASFRTYTGGNFSTRDDIFYKIDEIDMLNHSRAEWTLSGPVPLLGKKVTFFTSGVFEKDNGHLKGMRVYNRDEILVFSEDRFFIDPLGASGEAFQADGDREIVPMVTSESINATAKLTWKPNPKIKVHYDLVMDDGERFSSGNFRRYRFNPDGRPKTFSNGLNHSLGLTHTLNDKMFYTLKFGLAFTHNRTHAFEDPFDKRYVRVFDSLITNSLIAPTDYLAGGTSLDRSFSKTRSIIAKLDVVNQIHPAHELKFGAELQLHRLESESYTLIYDLNPDNQPQPCIEAFGADSPCIPFPELDENFTDYQFFKHEPIQAAAYFLDKIELSKSFILNLGLRYEFLDSRALYNPDLVGTVDEGVEKSENLRESSPKHRLAPRLSLSFPITSRGIIRFSYGHFYQNPRFSQIYRNPRFEDFNFTRTPTFGNANLEPQRSIQYEMGLQQQFTDNFKADFTIFYKDVTNLIESRRVIAGEVGGQKEFNVVTNISYANVKGFSISLLKRRSQGGILSGSLDYTFQVGEGAFDNPLRLAINTRSGRDSEQSFVPLSFDRTHTLNATLTLSKANNWAFSAIGNVWTGTPYTPSLPSSLQPVEFEVRSARRPLTKNLDIKLEKFFRQKNVRFSIFMQVENVFDFINERFVHTNTGRSLTSLNETINPTLFNNVRRQIERNPENFFPISFLDNFYQREDWLGAPREIRWGMSFDF
ncbi:MAG: TonB-dependent receptor domain-containing protein [bacterium]